MMIGMGRKRSSAGYEYGLYSGAVGLATNTQFALGVHVLTMLAGLPRELQTSEGMAASAGSNPVHLRRVLGRLREAGLVSSRPGPGGGWQLVRAPEATTLADVWRVMNGDAAVLGLHEASPACPVGRRIQDDLTEVDRRVRAAIGAELERTTLADLAAEPAVAR
jgi:Rrf2 family protein